jgi:hypothetical protein
MWYNIIKKLKRGCKMIMYDNCIEVKDINGKKVKVDFEITLQLNVVKNTNGASAFITNAGEVISWNEYKKMIKKIMKKS